MGWHRCVWNCHSASPAERWFSILQYYNSVESYPYGQYHPQMIPLKYIPNCSYINTDLKHQHMHPHTYATTCVGSRVVWVCLWEGLVVGLSKWMKNDWFDLKEWSDEGTDWTSLFPLVKKHSVEFQVMSSYSQHWIHSSSISWNYMIYNTFWRILGSRI